MKTIKPKKCAHCGEPIPKVRLQYLPDTEHCVKCVDKYGPKRVVVVEDITAQTAVEGRNGFAPKS